MPSTPIREYSQGEDVFSAVGPDCVKPALSLPKNLPRTLCKGLHVGELLRAALTDVFILP